MTAPITSVPRSYRSTSSFESGEVIGPGVMGAPLFCIKEPDSGMLSRQNAGRDSSSIPAGVIIFSP